MKISQLPENIEASLQNSVINPVKTFFLWWADLFNVVLTRISGRIGYASVPVEGRGVC